MQQGLINRLELSSDDKRSVERFLSCAKKVGLNALCTEAQLHEVTDTGTEKLINQILQLDPTDYGFSGPRLSLEPVPAQAIRVSQSVESMSGEYDFNNQVYLPKHVHDAFSVMAEGFAADHPDRRLLIGSGYRSPAYQTVTLLYILARVYDFDVQQTLRRVALPGYSQHCQASNTAIDMLNIDSQPSDDDPQQFSKSIEYAWLQANAHDYGFVESYPPGNPDGIMWEPWHWQYTRR